MMNLLALSLVITSLVTAGVWSPSPQNPNPQRNEDVILKEGHRVIVIEYDKDGRENTKVSISPEPDHHVRPHKPASVSIAEDKMESAATGAVGIAKEKIKEAASVLPNLGQGVCIPSSEGGGAESHHEKELICDAYGKCKEKIVDMVGKTIEKASERARDVEKAGRDAGDVVGNAYNKARETAEDAAERAKETVKTPKDTAKTIGEHLGRNASQKAEFAREKVAEKAKEAKEAAEETAVKIKTKSKKLPDAFRRTPYIAYNIINHFFPEKTLNSLTNVMNLLGFAMAYGICVWVTFVSSNVLAAALPRQQFGMVQSKVYPVYFRAMAFSVGLALLGHVLSQRHQLVSSKAERFHSLNLLTSLLAVLVNSAYLEPQATKVLFERMKIEKEEGRGISDSSRVTEPDPKARTPSSDSAAAERLEQEMVRTRMVKLSQRLKKLNTYSSLVNILTLMGLTWHLVYLAQRLHIAC